MVHLKRLVAGRHRVTTDSTSSFLRLKFLGVVLIRQLVMRFQLIPAVAVRISLADLLLSIEDQSRIFVITSTDPGTDSRAMLDVVSRRTDLACRGRARLTGP